MKIASSKGMRTYGCEEEWPRGLPAGPGLLDGQQGGRQLLRLEPFDDGHRVEVDGGQDDPIVHGVQDGAARNLCEVRECNE